ncbi:MAG: 3-keto-5-aminohexanoate cleavage protein [Deltaproteobacteria bacterium]|nr:3-keto-5-aminohexanoate cleavage protein [Deltaproteobacteria bacterium]MBU51638.1 3-keto-5-aminohexanoate cleavage protein [Deltaproteobacteria bacterium]|tara:strand:+ start:7518 stop:8387 length:870 start_codon:yes stop_codon:yes gene_type:complete
MAEKAVISCALTGVLTDPDKFPVPVTPGQMAQSAKEAFDAGAAIMHIHVRNQEEGMGRFPSWDADDAEAVCDAIRAACPGVILNMTTGVIGDDISGPVACLERVKPEMAALNAGSLNYLRARSNGTWAWPPMLFDNPVSKIEQFIEVMHKHEILPECECFDTGIVRSVGLFKKVGMLKHHVDLSLVMGVASGMPAKPAWLPLLVDEIPEGATWQVIGIGRQEVWELHRKAAELGGNLRTGLEDTFYLPSGERASSNGALIEAMATLAREVGREIASPQEARKILGLRAE